MRKALTLSVLLVAGLASPVAAATIDFRDAAFAGSDGESQLEYTASDGVTLTITPQPQPDATLYWDASDGFGVRYSYESDEIEGAENLTIDFSESVYLSEVQLTDLFNEGYLEQGQYSINGGPAVGFTADPTQVPGTTNGEQTLTIGQEVTSITFTAPGRIFRNWSLQDHEFSIGGISYDRVEVPELDANAAGSSLALLLGGAFVLGAARRRQRA